MKTTWLIKYISIISLLTLSLNASAGLISQTLGNGASGLVDGDTPGFAASIFPIQSGQLAPFDGAIGQEILTNAPNVNWIFNYGAITDTITSATFSFGIWDHDSSASDSQLEAFSMDGTDQTAALNDLFEAAGGALDNQYKVYTFDLGAAFFNQLADGVFSVNLDIGGKGLLTNGLTQVVSESNENAYHLIFSTISINTEVAANPPTNSVPEPGTLLLFASGLLAFRKRILN